MSKSKQIPLSDQVERTKRFLLRTAKLLHGTAKMLEQAAQEYESPKGVYLVKSTFGYDVQVDGLSLGLDVAYGEAAKLVDQLKQARKK
jgi:hypothetical protein